jgi:lipoic acid synthetase
VKTKSGIMVGLGETDEEILQVMRDMREHDIDMLTIGQYLAPSNSHLPVRRYVHPDVFKMFEEEAYKMGFKHAAVGAMVRSPTTRTSRRMMCWPLANKSQRRSIVLTQ